EERRVHVRLVRLAPARRVHGGAPDGVRGNGGPEGGCHGGIVGNMRITKFGHACVRIEHDGTTVVLVPGVFTDRSAVDVADYVLDLGGTKVYLPGDSLTEPGEAVDVLLCPVSAPWMRASEAIEFARAVRAPRTLAIHDRVYSEAGLGIVDGHMNAFLPQEGLE